MASNIIDFKDLLTSSYQSDGSKKNIGTWLQQDVRSKFNQTDGKYYYNNILEKLDQFKVLFSYLEQLSNRFGYQQNDAIDIKKDIERRFKFLIDRTGFEESFLNQLFSIDDLNNLIEELTSLSAKSYIFNAKEIEKIPGQKAIDELISIQKSRGSNKADLQSYYLNADKVSSFLDKTYEVGGLRLYPIRDSNGNIDDFNLGVNMSGSGGRRRAIRIMSDIGATELGGLPIDRQDAVAVDLINAIIQGRQTQTDINGVKYNFASELVGANAGQRHEALIESVYRLYNSKNKQGNQNLITGQEIKEQILPQLISSTDDGIKFIIPAGISGATAPDMRLLLNQVNTQEEQWVQGKTLGESARYTYTTVVAVGEVSGFYGGVGPLNQQINTILKSEGQEMQQQGYSMVDNYCNQINTKIWGLFTEEIGMEAGTQSEDFLSTEDVVNLMFESLYYGS